MNTESSTNALWEGRGYGSLCWSLLHSSTSTLARIAEQPSPLDSASQGLEVGSLWLSSIIVVQGRMARYVVTGWACAKIALVSFGLGVVVGFQLKKTIRRAATKLLKKIREGDWGVCFQYMFGRWKAGDDLHICHRFHCYEVRGTQKVVPYNEKDSVSMVCLQHVKLNKRKTNIANLPHLRQGLFLSGSIHNLCMEILLFWDGGSCWLLWDRWFWTRSRKSFCEDCLNVDSGVSSCC